MKFLLRNFKITALFSEEGMTYFLKVIELGRVGRGFLQGQVGGDRRHEDEAIGRLPTGAPHAEAGVQTSLGHRPG